MTSVLITHDQMRTVCATLGLPPEIVRTVTVDARDGLTAVLHIRDGHGRVVILGDGPLIVTVRMPILATAEEEELGFSAARHAKRGRHA